MADTYDAVICGAGIAGIAAAYELAVRRGWKRVALVDERDPLSLTSDKSTEAYRNWWPGPDAAMVGLMNRSIDLLEVHANASGNRFRLNRRGYVYATADPARLAQFQQAGEQAAAQGAGPLRLNDYQPHTAEGFEGAPTGADLLTDAALIGRHFPYLSPTTVALVHARRCGWFSSTELGTYLLERARAAGVELIRDRVCAVEAPGARVQTVGLAGGRRLASGVFINAAGPLVNEVAALSGISLPVFCERHTKVAFHDPLGVVPRDAPLLIWADPQRLTWDDDERVLLAEDPETAWMLQELPAGVHTRPEGGHGSDVLLMLWAYDAHPVPPAFPPAFDPSFDEVVLRGLTSLLPGLAVYRGKAARPAYDGGYYTKTRENRLLAGPLPIDGAYVLGAFSGYGLMAACGAAELLGAHLAGDRLPEYAQAFSPARYTDPAYLDRLATWDDSGQL
jgi:sarcosine oxidase, subunit beta